MPANRRAVLLHAANFDMPERSGRHGYYLSVTFAAKTLTLPGSADAEYNTSLQGEEQTAAAKTTARGNRRQHCACPCAGRACSAKEQCTTFVNQT